MKASRLKIKDFVNLKNKKIVFTPGPGSLLEENIIGLAPYFGRGDLDYLKIEESVLRNLKKISGLKKIVPFQGSGSLAIEIALQNFVYGKILIVNTGYYSERLNFILKNLKYNFKKIKKIEIASWKEIKNIKKKL